MASSIAPSPNYLTCTPSASSPPTQQDWASATAYPIARPRTWPEVLGAGDGDKTTVSFVHTEDDLFARFSCAGAFREPVSEASEGSRAFGKEQGVPEAVTSVLDDDRVEIFIGLAAAGSEEAPDYCAIECNRGGKALTNAARWGKRFGFCSSWGSTDGWGELVSCRGGGDGCSLELVLRVSKWPWRGQTAAAAGSSTSGKAESIIIGAFRAQQRQGAGGESDFSWTSAVDPGDDAVNFHRPECFAPLVFKD